MKARLNLTIEEHLLQKIKAYAEAKNISISEIVESYFSKLASVETPQKPSILDFVKDIKPVEYPKDFDFKKEYYERSGK